MTTTNRDWKRFLARALDKRCPRCGESALFLSRFRLAERCTACRLLYRREEGAMTGQMYLSAAVTQVVAALWIGLVFVFTDWNTLTAIAVLVPAVLLFSYWFLPHAMALWVAIEFMTDVGNREHWVDGEGGQGEG